MKLLLFLFLLFTELDAQVVSNTSNKTNTIVIGHIGAVGALPKYEKILELSRKELLEDGILGPDFDIEIVSRDGCGDAFEGVAAAADLYHIEHVTAFLGPYCNGEMIPVATMANYWNLPIIAYMATANSLADKKVYKTLVRTSLRTMNTIAESTSAFIKHNKWTKVALVSNMGTSAYEKLQAFDPVLKKHGITVTRRIMFEEYATAKDMVNSGLMDDLKASARIVLVMFSSQKDLTNPFKEAMDLAGISTTEFVFIFPWLQVMGNTMDSANGASPFVGSDSSILATVKKTYSNSILIDDTNGFDDRMITPFSERLSKVGLTKDDVDLTNIYGYITLFDALKMFATAGRRILNSTGNFQKIRDGTLMWNTMRRMNIPGMVSNAGIGSGTVMLDDLAERLPFYSAFYVDKARNQVRAVANMTPKMVDNCDGLKSGTGCFDIIVSDISSSFWSSSDGQLPKDEPVCGFRNEKCDYTLIIIALSAVVAFILSVAGAWFLRRYCETRALDNMPWRVFRDDVRVVDEEQVKSMLSMGSQSTKLSNMNNMMIKHHAIIGINTHATFHLYEQRRPIKFGRQDLTLLMRMKQAVHDNINPFLGMCFNEKNELLLLWKFCSRGTLQDVIYNEQIVLDSKFHGAFIRDITLGLEYLHSSPIGFHGSLTPWAALIDRNWMVKLTDYAISDPIKRWEKHGSVNTETLKEGDEKSGASQALERTRNPHFILAAALYVAPEIRTSNDKNQRRRMDQSWVTQSIDRRRAADIYAFGVVIYEILFRTLPFPDKMDLTELATRATAGDRIAKPQIQKDKVTHPDLIALLQDCWNDTPDIRPTVRRVRLSTESYLQVKGSLVDQMMRMMEEYANNLEKTVKDRTGMLEEATQRADKLLTQLLPKYVATELKHGRSVPPKLYGSATILFTDIVVALLNSVYSGFDAIINKHEGYKVETIGDAYMVVSGIPEENGKRHVSNIADTTLDMIEFLKTFQIPHRRAERLCIRLGFHSGPVAAGVVGLNAPRYCLFGDSVSMASLMESSGEPMRVHISQQSRDLLCNEYPEFVIESRGEMEIKPHSLQKITIETFWLIKKDKEYFKRKQ